MKQIELADRTPPWIAYKSVANTAIQALLVRALHKAGGVKQDVAKAIGVTPSRFTKLLNQSRGNESPRVISCFLLADYLGDHPDTVLQAANHGDVVEAIKKHCGPMRKVPPTPTVDPLVSELVEVLAQPTVDRAAVKMFLKLLKPPADGPASNQVSPARRRDPRR